MHPVLQKLIDEKAPLDLNPPATLEAIAQFEQQQGVTLPDYYKEFLQFGNGGHLFGPAGPDFYGVDRNSEYYSLEKANSFGARMNLPNTFYVIGATSYGDRYCIDMNNNELVQWNHETNKESRRWATVFELFERELNSYIEDKEDEEKEYEENLEVRDIFISDDESLFVTFNKSYEGKMFCYDGWIKENGLYQISPGSAEEISPISRDAIPEFEDINFLRKVPEIERYHLRDALEAYVKANPGVFVPI